MQALKTIAGKLYLNMYRSIFNIYCIGPYSSLASGFRSTRGGLKVFCWQRCRFLEAWIFTLYGSLNFKSSNCWYFSAWRCWQLSYINNIHTGLIIDSYNMLDFVFCFKNSIDNWSYKARQMSRDRAPAFIFIMYGNNFPLTNVSLALLQVFHVIF